MQVLEIKVPDIGDFKEVEIIELSVKPGDTIKVDQSLITVETDKASMEIPSTRNGIVRELKVKLGDKVAEGSLILMVELSQSDATQDALTAVSTSTVTPIAELAPAVTAALPALPIPMVPASATAIAPDIATKHMVRSHASPSIRKFSRTMGVDLSAFSGTGPKGRILKADVESYVKSALTSGAHTEAKPTSQSQDNGLDLLPWPSLDFSKFGATELQALTRIKKISGPNLHRNWVMIPHVTQFDQADVTELEDFRKSSNANLAKLAETKNIKLTLLAFVIKASIVALKRFPAFNASLDASAQNLILKQYYHIGFAADTPNGLVVPVIKNADQKSIVEIASEMAQLSAQARDGKLKPNDMQGASFTISSLGGIGGTGFTPIINAPEVAILGLAKAEMKPVWNGEQFIPRLIIPMSLSYDHRVVDGVMGARFTGLIAELLADLRKILL